MLSQLRAVWDQVDTQGTWAQRRDGEPLKRVFERAAIGLIFPCAHCVVVPSVSSDGAAFGSLTQT